MSSVLGMYPMKTNAPDAGVRVTVPVSLSSLTTVSRVSPPWNSLIFWFMRKWTLGFRRASATR